MKSKLLIFLLFTNTQTLLYSQEWDLGLQTGIMSEFNFEPVYPTIHAILEYQPEHSPVSFNLNPGIFLTESNVYGFIPLKLKFIIGDKYRICPEFGGFYTFNRRWGWSAGLNFEARVTEKLTPFIQASYMRAFYKYFIPYHFGGGSYGISNFNVLHFSVGCRYGLR